MEAGGVVKKLKLYNSMTKEKEEFKPKSEGGKRVGVYVCGVTAYDLSHIGHARAYVAFDLLFRNEPEKVAPDQGKLVIDDTDRHTMKMAPTNFGNITAPPFG